MESSHSRGRELSSVVNKTVGEVQEEVARTFPHKEFLIDLAGEERFTFEQFDKITDLLARSYIGSGLEQGERVGIAMNNTSQWLISYFGAFKAGVLPVNIGPRLKKDSLKYMIDQSELSCLIGDERNSNLALKIEDALDVVTVGGEPPRGGLAWEDYLQRGRSVSSNILDRREANITPDDTLGLCYTSGTTGKPKGVVLSHRALVNQVQTMIDIFGYDSEDVIPLNVPMYHIFGWVLSLLALYGGMKLVMPTSYVRPESVLQCLEGEKCTTMGTAPQIYRFFVGSPQLDQYDLSSCTHCFSGSDILSEELIDLIYSRLGVDTLQNLWGATEMGGVVTINRKDDPREKLTSIGKVIPGAEIKVVDPGSGKTVPRGEQGEIWVRSQYMFDGYWNMPQKTDEKVTEQGWLKSGDLGYLDEQDYLHFVGRVDDVFKKGAEKVAPAPIENILSQHPEVVEAGVVGVPDKKYGLEVGAFIQLKEETLQKIQQGRDRARELEQELRRMARDRLESFKVPKHIKFVKQLPRTSTGKIRHFILKKKAKRLERGSS